MDWNKIFNLTTEKEYDVLNVDFSIFQSKILGAQNLKSILQNFKPYGSEFDDGNYDFSIKDLVFHDNENWYSFNDDFFKNKILNASYHNGFRYNFNKPVNLYGIDINLGTVIYIEDESYLREIRKKSDFTIYKNKNFGATFIFMTMPNVQGYDWEVGHDENGYFYNAVYKTGFNHLTTYIKGPTGATRWNFFKIINENCSGIVNDETNFFRINSRTLYINKKYILSGTKRMSPLDEQYGIKFFIASDSKYSPLDVDFSWYNDRLYDYDESTYIDCIKIIFDDDYSIESLDWLNDNCAVMVY